jgi:hypothetical protein
MKLNNPTELSGIFGESITIRKVNGSVVITNRPKKKRGPPTAKELAHRARISEAAKYASSISDNPAMLALYATGMRKKNDSPQSVAIGDFMNPPTVKSIGVNKNLGVIGNIIRVNAVDDFQVIKVTITITDADGVVIEQGEANDISKELLNHWEYKAVTASSLKGMKIEAIAYDRPGNQGRAEITL